MPCASFLPSHILQAPNTQPQGRCRIFLGPLCPKSARSRSRLAMSPARTSRPSMVPAHAQNAPFAAVRAAPRFAPDLHLPKSCSKSCAAARPLLRSKNADPKLFRAPPPITARPPSPAAHAQTNHLPPCAPRRTFHLTCTCPKAAPNRAWRRGPYTGTKTQFHNYFVRSQGVRQ